ncbi:RNA helicase [Pontibacillus halophilus JSM 076056 = DSM 19796]|uniref:RNA helicase n=1 Tax=Pontibacillus halophilus JSM 076056 = DSM 19796 TaxID=1385510 RepID=A0A0A5GME2_9BACI|nr:DEAD/DEAH box helicase [Pontibacillus halophilus]KGX92335.1 RNA helicase [Pontibacillus halophilus JSM 076056 = DSM 19796]
MESKQQFLTDWGYERDVQPFIYEAWEKAGFETATSVQQQSSPIIQSGDDLIAEAPTGSGKTLAYLLPVLQKIDPEKKHVQALILASSHELVMQIHEQIQKWSTGSGYSSATLIGGANVKRQIEKLKKKPKIVVGTPGRVQELINQKKLKMHEVQTLIFDEADQLMVPEHKETIYSILKSAQSETQILLFSATLPQEVAEDAQSFMKQPKVVRVSRDEVETPHVDHIYFLAEEREKIDLLRKIVRGTEKKTLAFTNHIDKVLEMAEKLQYKKVAVDAIHRESKKDERANAIKNLRTGKSEALIATDIAARGLDIPDLPQVVNLDIPTDVTQYIHRSGRTGRLGSNTEGTVISIVTPREEKELKRYCKQLNVPLTKKIIRKGQIIDA